MCGYMNGCMKFAGPLLPTLHTTPHHTSILTCPHTQFSPTARDFEAPLKLAIERVKALKADIKAGKPHSERQHRWGLLSYIYLYC